MAKGKTMEEDRIDGKWAVAFSHISDTPNK